MINDNGQVINKKKSFFSFTLLELIMFVTIVAMTTNSVIMNYNCQNMTNDVNNLRLAMPDMKKLSNRLESLERLEEYGVYDIEEIKEARQ